MSNVRNSSFRIPRPADTGGRHNQLIQMARELNKSSVPREAAFDMMRAYQPAMPAGELQGILNWAFSFKAERSLPVSPAVAPQVPVPPSEAAAARCSPVTCEEISILSPVPVEASEVEAFCQFMQALYAADEFVNVVVNFDQRDCGLFKTKPIGGGITLTSADWVNRVRAQGIPFSNAGGWFRPNPVPRVGTGGGGSFKDSDVLSYRFLLVESDDLPQALALGLIASLQLPISAIYTSGGSSRQQEEQGIHALAKIDCADEDTYDRFAAQILSTLEPFGIDPGNKNPSRLSRLPGARRTIGGVGDGIQRLLYLNPNPTTTPIKVP